jgi:hypothetical protein
MREAGEGSAGKGDGRVRFRKHCGGEESEGWIPGR